MVFDASLLINQGLNRELLRKFDHNYVALDRTPQHIRRDTVARPGGTLSRMLSRLRALEARRTLTHKSNADPSLRLTGQSVREFGIALASYRSGDGRERTASRRWASTGTLFEPTHDSDVTTPGEHVTSLVSSAGHNL